MRPTEDTASWRLRKAREEKQKTRTRNASCWCVWKAALWRSSLYRQKSSGVWTSLGEVCLDRDVKKKQQGAAERCVCMCVHRSIVWRPFLSICRKGCHVTVGSYCLLRCFPFPFARHFYFPLPLYFWGWDGAVWKINEEHLYRNCLCCRKYFNVKQSL